MKKLTFKDLFIADDIQTGEDIYYEDESLTIPYTGVIVDYFKGKLSWECEIKNGFKEGIEKVYYDDTGELAAVNEVSKNTLNGISTEYYKSGKIMHKSIVLGNAHIDTISYDEEGNIIERVSISKDNPPPGIYLDWEKIEEFRKKYVLE